MRKFLSLIKKSNYVIVGRVWVQEEYSISWLNMIGQECGDGIPPGTVWRWSLRTTHLLSDPLVTLLANRYWQITITLLANRYWQITIPLLTNRYWQITITYTGKSRSARTWPWLWRTLAPTIVFLRPALHPVWLCRCVSPRKLIVVIVVVVVFCFCLIFWEHSCVHLFIHAFINRLIFGHVFMPSAGHFENIHEDSKLLLKQLGLCVDVREFNCTIFFVWMLEFILPFIVRGLTKWQNHDMDRMWWWWERIMLGWYFCLCCAKAATRACVWPGWQRGNKTCIYTTHTYTHAYMHVYAHQIHIHPST